MEQLMDQHKYQLSLYGHLRKENDLQFCCNTIEGKFHLRQELIPQFRVLTGQTSKHTTHCSIDRFSLTFKLRMASTAEIEGCIKSFTQFLPKMTHDLYIPISFKRYRNSMQRYYFFEKQHSNVTSIMNLSTSKYSGTSQKIYQPP